MDARLNPVYCATALLENSGTTRSAGAQEAALTVAAAHADEYGLKPNAQLLAQVKAFIEDE